ncbi:MAG: hypothetical protein ABWY06_11415 [Pseudomonas sp.]|uniref:hypothetical protein n=1 Tax=Pseudomonas sp. TaxID=306 RepID=UPI00339866DB
MIQMTFSAKDMVASCGMLSALDGRTVDASPSFRAWRGASMTGAAKRLTGCLTSASAWEQERFGRAGESREFNSLSTPPGPLSTGLPVVSDLALPQDNAASQGFDDAAHVIYTAENGTDRTGVSRIRKESPKCLSPAQGVFTVGAGLS